ncbi:MAG: ATP-binding protein, partial [Oscillospiraceae bacterium]|nr:ATP-binding protein [Oscillospiraceae bacterium]
DPAAVLARLQPQAEAAAAQKAKILTALGLPASGEPEIACPRCRDEGFVNGEPCVCFRRIYREEQLRENARLFRLSGGEKGDFRPEEFSAEPDPERGVSDRKLMESVVRRIEGFAGLPGEDLLFTGESGIGKKFLTARILRIAVDAGEYAVYAPAYALARRFETERFGRSDTPDEELERTRGASLLILDELGTEQTTAYSAAAFLDLIDSRLADGRITVITTSLSFGEIAVRYNPETLLRLRERFKPYSIPLTQAEKAARQ